MPLLSEHANYGDWETEAKRWSTMLYNRPVSFGVDYFVSNLKGRETAKIDVDAGGFMEHEASSKN